MARYRVTFDITLNSGHPRKWIPDTVSQGLETGEDVTDWDFVELPEDGDKPTVAQIASAAEQSCFYVTPEGQWLRIDSVSVEDGRLYAHDENSLEDYCFELADLVDENPHFEKLERVIIS